MESQAGALIKRKRLGFSLVFHGSQSHCCRAKIADASSSWSSMGLALACRTPVPICCRDFSGESLFSLPRRAVLQKSGIEAGSYQPPRQGLLWTPGIIIVVFMVQEHQPLRPTLCSIGTVCQHHPRTTQSPGGSKGCWSYPEMMEKASPGSKPRCNPRKEQEKKGTNVLG